MNPSGLWKEIKISQWIHLNCLRATPHPLHLLSGWAWLYLCYLLPLIKDCVYSVLCKYFPGLEIWREGLSCSVLRKNTHSSDNEAGQDLRLGWLSWRQNSGEPRALGVENVLPIFPWPSTVRYRLADFQLSASASPSLMLSLEAVPGLPVHIHASHRGPQHKWWGWMWESPASPFPGELTQRGMRFILTSEFPELFSSSLW